jgi:hypothetical protein
MPSRVSRKAAQWPNSTPCYKHSRQLHGATEPQTAARSLSRHPASGALNPGGPCLAWADPLWAPQRSMGCFGGVRALALEKRRQRLQTAILYRIRVRSASALAPVRNDWSNVFDLRGEVPQTPLCRRVRGPRRQKGRAVVSQRWTGS